MYCLINIYKIYLVLLAFARFLLYFYLQIFSCSALQIFFIIRVISRYFTIFSAFTAKLFKLIKSDKMYIFHIYIKMRLYLYMPKFEINIKMCRLLLLIDLLLSSHKLINRIFKFLCSFSFFTTFS